MNSLQLALDHYVLRYYYHYYYIYQHSGSSLYGRPNYIELRRFVCPPSLTFVTLAVTVLRVFDVVPADDVSSLCFVHTDLR